MDPVSHALFGRALHCLDSKKRFGTGAGAAFVLGSLAPDIDGALVTRGWDVYLHYHPTGTHTLLAAPLLAAATAGLVRLLRRGSSYVSLFIAALIGVVIGHLAFDLVSGSDMRLFWPFSSRVFGPHLLTMADVIAIGILLAGTVVSWWRRSAGGVVVAAGLTLLLLIKAMSLHLAWAIYTPQGSRADVVARPEAFNGSLTLWRFFDRAGAVARAWTVDSRLGVARIDFTRAVGGDDDVVLVEGSKAAPAVRRFFSFAELPIVRVEQSGGERRVIWSDLKYCEASGCVMSFGAVVDDRGAPIVDVVQIGGYVRRRPLR